MIRSAGMRDILLIVIGLNSLILSTIVRLDATANMILITVGLVMLLVGANFTTRNLLRA